MRAGFKGFEVVWSGGRAVDALVLHLQPPRSHDDPASGAARPDEATPLQAVREQARPPAIPPQVFDTIPAPAETQVCHAPAILTRVPEGGAIPASGRGEHPPGRHIDRALYGDPALSANMTETLAHLRN